MIDKGNQAVPRSLTSRNTHNKTLEILSSKTLGLLLDAPAGEGAFAARWRALGGSAISLDRDISVSRANVSCLLADLNGFLPLNDCCFDAISCIDGIKHLENPFLLIREFYRILKNPGYLVISTPNVLEIRSRIRFLFSGFYNKFKRPLDESIISFSAHINPITYPELRYILHISGFKIETVTVNQIKFQSFFYLPFVPLIKLYTFVSLLYREKNPVQQNINKEIVKHMTNIYTLLGETLIVLAKKEI